MRQTLMEARKRFRSDVFEASRRYRGNFHRSAQGFEQPAKDPAPMSASPPAAFLESHTDARKASGRWKNILRECSRVLGEVFQQRGAMCRTRSGAWKGCFVNVRESSGWFFGNVRRCGESCRQKKADRVGMSGGLLSVFRTTRVDASKTASSEWRILRERFEASNRSFGNEWHRVD